MMERVLSPARELRIVADLKEQRRREAQVHVKEAASFEHDSTRLRREIDRLVNALAATDDKPDALIQAIAERQAKLRDAEKQAVTRKRTPDALEQELAVIERAARDAIQKLRETLLECPNEGREVAASLFSSMTFTPVKTPEGPRYRIEGVAEVGRLLGVEGGRANVASPGRLTPFLTPAGALLESVEAEKVLFQTAA